MDESTKVDMSEPLDLKKTINLPKTDFSMKANLPKLESGMLAVWQRMDLYQRIRAARKGREVFVLHDGPPYANGHIHLGHALNKSLKDVIVKSKTMEGYDAPYLPGWDCHGLPIEIKVVGKKTANMDLLKVRRECREYAQKFVEIQKEEFKAARHLWGVGRSLFDHESPVRSGTGQTLREICGAGECLQGTQAGALVYHL